MPTPSLNSELAAKVAELRASGLTSREIQERLSVSAGTVSKYSKPIPVTPPPPANDAPPEPAERRTIRRLQDENTRLRGQVADQERAEVTAEQIREIIGSIGAAVLEPPKWLTPRVTSGRDQAEVLMTSWTDWHWGEVVRPSEVYGANEFNPAIAKRRAERLLATTIHLAREHGPSRIAGAVVNLGGDFVSGGLHEELRKTDAFPAVPAVLELVPLLVHMLKAMADEFGQVFVPCVCGNHGRMTHRPEFKGYANQNWDYLIYQLIARELRDDRRIKLLIPDATDAIYQVFGMTFALTHGDMLGVKGGDGLIGSIGPIMRGEIKTRAQQTSLGRGYDVLLMGHWHQMLWLPRAIVAGSLKGYDEYAGKGLRAPPAPPSQPLWFVHPKHGITSRREILLEDRKDADSRWVTWQAA